MSEDRKDPLLFDEIDEPFALRRREFLTLLGSGIVVLVSVGEEVSAQVPGGAGGRGQASDLNAFLRIGGDGRVTCFTGKIEMGQGINTSLPQMLAEDLDVPLESVDIILGDTELCPWDMGTFGSLTTRSFGPALRAAAAEARAALLELAAERLATPVERLEANSGAIFDRTRPQVRATYAELARGQRIERHVTQKPALKPPAEFAVMRKPVARRDAREKVTGEARFAGDIRLPGMLYASILRPPAHGARLRRLDVSAAERIAGVRVVQVGDLVAVLHEYPDVAAAALRTVKADYDVPQTPLDDKNIYRHLEGAAPEGRSVAQGGNLAEGIRMAASVIEGKYFNAYVAHAPLETHTALAEVEGGKATVWASTQAPFRARDEVAAALNLPARDVRVITPFVGGGFGGKTRNPQAVQAARLAQIAGRPVQVAWSRADEFFHDTFRPAAVVRIKSGLSSSGRIVLWDYEVLFAGERGSRQFYDIPHHRTVVRGEWMGGGDAAHPFPIGAWRAPAANTNTFAREVQIDIMAARAGLDPLEFRLRNLSDERMKRVLKATAGKFGWTPAPAPSRRGLGICCADYLGTYVAAAAEVAVDQATGAVRVKRVVCAQDMGIAVNPDGARLQIEGCVTMGLGYALGEEVRFKGREVLDLNFDTYQIPVFSWVPEIETVLVDSPELAPSGGGEPAVVIMAAVLANAIYDATGARLFELPMTPVRIREALKQ